MTLISHCYRESHLNFLYRAFRWFYDCMQWLPATIQNLILFILLWSSASRGLTSSTAADPVTNLRRKKK